MVIDRLISSSFWLQRKPITTSGLTSELARCSCDQMSSLLLLFFASPCLGLLSFFPPVHRPQSPVFSFPVLPISFCFFAHPVRLLLLLITYIPRYVLNR
ncbi:hypothetical protein F4809DRAFT_508018 [Biscogniauxia mediterranea]|nr:hypothetical protein F4809DRAFT_508018 [Biscogniauxia mediterranea]